MSGAPARPAWRGYALSLLLHAALLGAVVVWTPKVIEVVRTYEVEILTVQPVIRLSAEPPAPAPKKTEPPPKPPEPKKEILPPPPKPEPVLVAAVAKPEPMQLAHIAAPSSVVQSSLRIAVTSAPVPALVAVETAATNSAPLVASGNGAEEVSDPAYISTVRAAVARHLRYPELALRRGAEGRVVLRLTLDAAGRLLDSGAGESTAGDRALLTAALAAVKRAAPFPPWQGVHHPDATLNLTLPIRFKLEER